MNIYAKRCQQQSPHRFARLIGYDAGMDQPPATRRRFRFGLRTLLVVVTLAAVASWGYWVAWPWWQAHREQVDFETAVQKLQRSDVDLSVLPKNQNDMMQSIFRLPNYYEVGKFIRTNASFCIVLKDLPSWALHRTMRLRKHFGIPIATRPARLQVISRA